MGHAEAPIPHDENEPPPRDEYDDDPICQGIDWVEKFVAGGGRYIKAPSGNWLRFPFDGPNDEAMESLLRQIGEDAPMAAAIWDLIRVGFFRTLTPCGEIDIRGRLFKLD